MNDLDWLPDVVAQLPEAQKVRKNYFEIAGFPRWELVSSNMLAFYFDTEEEHGFKDLFLQSLFDAIEAKLASNKGKADKSFQRELYSYHGDICVIREFRTSEIKRIDLVIKKQGETGNEENSNSEWAILIENKFENAPLGRIHNDLGHYWESVKAKNKLGVVLSLYNIKDKSNLEGPGWKYEHLTHQELADAVLANLHLYIKESDSLHLLMLREYLNNLASLSKWGAQIMPEMEKILPLYQQHLEDIKKLNEWEVNIHKFVASHLLQVMAQQGFVPTDQTVTSWSKHFYPIEDFSAGKDFIPSGLRFWININSLKERNVLDGAFELYGKENTKYGEEMRSFVKKLEISSSPSIEDGSRGSSNGEFCHLVYYKIKLSTDTNQTFQSCLETVLTEHIFKHPKEYIQKISVKLAELKSGKSGATTPDIAQDQS
ncbi:MAG TPA: PD-(D/E)XK nuclease family protein [Saprospiraceae bacterium]|nr:PD-(D/E)XK nuclease family protein [Saprospiraceae bacterium]